MHHDYDYLIVGGGMAADSAATGLREQGATGSIGVVGDEPTPPFPRPALSKKLWTDPDFTVDGLWLGTSERTGAAVHLEQRVTGLDAGSRRVTTEGGDTYGYGRLLLATGGTPKQLPGLPPGDRVLYYRTLTDYRTLRDRAAPGTRVAVVGGGYIATEVAAALLQQGCRVTVAHPGELLGDRFFPRPVAERFESRFVEHGVVLRPGVHVEDGEAGDDGVTLRLDDSSTIEADLVVAGLGVEPATAFLHGALDLAEDGSVPVDAHLRTSADDVWAAGDIASYPDRILGRTRVEHVDNATTMGEVVGRIMAGSEETYDHTPFFYSDVLGVGYRAVGTLDPSLETFVDVVDAGSDDLVVLYADDDAVRGVLLWGDVDALDAARGLLARGDRPADLAGLAGVVRPG